VPQSEGDLEPAHAGRSPGPEGGGRAATSTEVGASADAALSPAAERSPQVGAPPEVGQPVEAERDAATAPLAWRPSAKAAAYAALLAFGTVVALLSGRPEAAVLAVPFAVALAVGLARTGPLALSVSAVAAKTSVTEGDDVPVVANFLAASDVPTLEVLVSPRPAFAPSGLQPGRPLGEVLAGGAPLELSMPVSAQRWGNYRVGSVVFRARSFLGFFEAGASVPVQGAVVVYPRQEGLRRLVNPRHAPLPAGDHFSPAKSTGFELAGVRPYAHGDRAKDVNWRASARHDGLFTNERHPERGSDIVLALDTIDASVVERAVRAACSLADAYLAQRDRVALLKLGGSLQWLRPGMGSRQRYILFTSLLSTSTLTSVIYRGVEMLPPRIIPASALIIGLSSLDDEHSRTAFVDMRARGLDVVVVELPPPTALAGTRGKLGALSYRIWRLQREMQRDGLRAAGIPVVEWEPGDPLAQVVEEVGAWSRRRARLSS
jgi:uncharacterized protein (DUF58 family)